MANLIIDQGNTNVKIALFEGGQLKQLYVEKELSESFLLKFFEKHSTLNAIYSSVQVLDEKMSSFLMLKSTFFVQLNSETPVPIINNYKTPKTLGMDRLSGIVGAMTLSKSKTKLIIDAGTALTYDLIDNNVYYGGAISLGLKMRFKALHDYTAKLPICFEEDNVSLVGNETQSAIRSGVINGMIAEIEGIVAAYQKKYPLIEIFLTGGNTTFLANKIKNDIFANQNLVIIGLNRILNYNVKE